MYHTLCVMTAPAPDCTYCANLASMWPYGSSQFDRLLHNVPSILFTVIGPYCLQSLDYTLVMLRWSLICMCNYICCSLFYHSEVQYVVLQNVATMSIKRRVRTHTLLLVWIMNSRGGGKNRFFDFSRFSLGLESRIGLESNRWPLNRNRIESWGAKRFPPLMNSMKYFNATKMRNINVFRTQCSVCSSFFHDVQC